MDRNAATEKCKGAHFLLGALVTSTVGIKSIRCPQVGSKRESLSPSPNPSSKDIISLTFNIWDFLLSRKSQEREKNRELGR